MFLPLAHVLARAVSIASFDAGAALGHTSDIPNLVPTFGEFKPDFILSVPRVFEKVYNSARAKAHGDGKGKIFDAAADTAVAWSEAQDKGGAGIVLKAKHALFDKLVYSKLRAALGGQCQLAISGGAPLGARLGHFFRGIGVTIYEGYGLTETTAAFAVNTIGAQKVGSVGKPLAGNSVRIAEDGEILLSGPVVFTGYWRNEKATAESIENGWFHTGDLGTVDKDGYITITGRKKEIIVTAGGKNVSPTQLEDSLRARTLISQAIVVGDQKPFIGALITIDAEALPAWNERNNKAAGTTAADLVSDGELVGEIQDAIDEANKLVSHAEAIKKFRILPVDFSEDTGELTPTMKLKRNVVHESFCRRHRKDLRQVGFSASSFSQQRTARTEFGAGRLRSSPGSSAEEITQLRSERVPLPVFGKPMPGRLLPSRPRDHDRTAPRSRIRRRREPRCRRPRARSCSAAPFPERHHCARR